MSEFSGRELIDCYGVNPRRIAITPNGIDHELYKPQTASAMELALARLHVPRPYFLSVGRLEAKKNIVTLIKAFNAYKAHRGIGDPTRLVLAGPRGFQYDQIKQEIHRSPHKDQIMELGYVLEEDKPFLYAGAKALLHVSWYEGFGIPPVEAMACGCPVIAADNSSLPDVLGKDNAILVPPNQPDAIARAMDRLDNEKDLPATLRQRGIDRAAQYTWRATAEATLPVLTQWLG